MHASSGQSKGGYKNSISQAKKKHPKSTNGLKIQIQIVENFYTITCPEHVHLANSFYWEGYFLDGYFVIAPLYWADLAHEWKDMSKLKEKWKKIAEQDSRNSH